MFDVGVTLTQSQRQIERAMLSQARDIIAYEWGKRLPRFSVEVRRLLREALEYQPEYGALVQPDGVLRGEFGLDSSAKDRVDRVIEVWLDSLTFGLYPVRVSGSGLSGGVYVRGVRSSMQDVVNLPEASYVSESSGETIPFISWLLTEGDRSLVKGYRYLANAGLGNSVSRSGNGLMIRKAGGIYRVNPAFSGTTKSNWSTRAIASMGPALADLFERTFTL